MKFIQNRFFIFFALLLSSVLYLTGDALSASGKTTDSHNEQKSIITATDITLRRADSLGVMYEGSVRSVFKDRDKEVLFGVSIAKIGESKEVLEANIITNFTEKTLFDEGFTYRDDKGVTLITGSAVYEKDKKTVTGSDGFTLSSIELNSRGDGFTYYIESKELKASNINAKFDGARL